MKHLRDFLMPLAPEAGVLVAVQCGDCHGTGSAETPRGSGRFDTCRPCVGTGEILVFEHEMEGADA